MAFFTVQTFSYPNSRFKDKIDNLLQALPHELKAKCNVATDPNDPEVMWNIQNYPGIWASSNRIGASVLCLPSEQLEQHKLINAKNDDGTDNLNIRFAPHIILAELETALKDYRLAFLDKKKQAEKKAIKHAIAKLKEALINEKLNFLYYTMQATAGHLQHNLSYCDLKEYHDALNEFDKLIDDGGNCNLMTASASLDFTKTAHKLTKAIKKAAEGATLKRSADATETKLPASDVEFINDKDEKEIINQTIKRQAEQLNILAKRFGDFFYENPRARTKPEQLRRILRVMAAVLAGLCAVAAIITFFIAPYLAPLFLLGTSVGYYLIADDFIELGRHFWHRRTPTKNQIFSYLIMLPFVLAYAALGHIIKIVPVLGEIIKFIKDHFTKVQSAVQFSADFIRKHMPYLSGLSNFSEVVAQTPLLQAVTVPGLIVISYQKIMQKISSATASDQQIPPDELNTSITFTRTSFLETPIAKIKEDKNQSAELDVEAQARQLIEKYNACSNEDLSKFSKENKEDLARLITATNQNNTFSTLHLELIHISKKIDTTTISSPLAHTPKLNRS